MTKKYLYNISNKTLGSKLWKRAQKSIAGGSMLLTKNPDRYLSDYWPSYFQKTSGCKVWDLNSKMYLDFSYMGVGTNSLGYSRKEVDKEVLKKISLGNMSTLNAPEEVYLSEKLLNLNPWAQKARFTRSGGEANAVAIRLARTFKRKDKILICGYHGWHDWYLSTNLSSKNNLNGHIIKGLNPGGVPSSLKNTTLSFKYNDIKTFTKLIYKHKDDIAAVKMEVVRNIQPKDDFLKKVREITKKHNIILIFDECTSGFRETYGGIYSKYKVTPDMIIYGKALGNGYAINAVLGKSKIMNSIDDTFISSTFWTERIGSTAALATLDTMKKEKSWTVITKIGKEVRIFWKDVFKKFEFDTEITGIPALSNFYFKDLNHLKYIRFISQEMLQKGFLANNVLYASTSHNKALLKKYFIAFEESCMDLREAMDKKNIDILLKKQHKIKKNFERLN